MLTLPKGGEGWFGCREQHVQRLGGPRALERSVWLRETPSLGERAQGTQERVGGEDEGGGQDFQDAGVCRSVEATEEDLGKGVA